MTRAAKPLPSQIFTMSEKAEQAARFSLVNSCFDEVAKIRFTKNKWIKIRRSERFL